MKSGAKAVKMWTHPLSGLDSTFFTADSMYHRHSEITDNLEITNTQRSQTEWSHRGRERKRERVCTCVCVYSHLSTTWCAIMRLFLRASSFGWVKDAKNMVIKRKCFQFRVHHYKLRIAKAVNLFLQKVAINIFSIKGKHTGGNIFQAAVLTLSEVRPQISHLPTGPVLCLLAVVLILASCEPIVALI